MTGNISAAQTSKTIEKKQFESTIHPQDFMPNFENLLQDGNQRVPRSFAFEDGLTFMTYGAKAIAQDEFSLCFRQKPRTQFSVRLFLLPAYCASFLFRYFFLFPYRICILLLASIGFFIMLPVVLYLDNVTYMRWLFTWYCQGFLRSFGSQIRYHGYKPKLDVPYVFVSNHTSFVDWIVLSAHEFPMATIAQKHNGLLGFFLGSVLKLNGTLEFNRNERSDRALISKKIREHVHTPSNSPLLIFPEGTCVNNEYTVLFHKGAFELDAVICPVAIKYNKRWADAYWASKNQSFTQHILYLMSRWAFVADVWYLPPMPKLEGETSSEFANRVKALISKQAKLKNLSWDGYFKNYAPAKDKAEKMQAQPQNRFYAVLMNRLLASKKLGSELATGQRRRARSISYGVLAQSPMQLNEKEWLQNACDSSSELTRSLSTEILKVASDNDPRMDMIKAIGDKKYDLVETWKKYTKVRSADIIARRIENLSWRLWFKRRIEAEREKQADIRRRMYEAGYYDDTPETISTFVSSLWGDVAATLSGNPNLSRTRSNRSRSSSRRSMSSDGLVNLAYAGLTSLTPLRVASGYMAVRSTGITEEVELDAPPLSKKTWGSSPNMRNEKWNKEETRFQASQVPTAASVMVSG